MFAHVNNICKCSNIFHERDIHFVFAHVNNMCKRSNIFYMNETSNLFLRTWSTCAKIISNIFFLLFPLLSCLAVRYGGQRRVLTKPFLVQIAKNVFHQNQKKQFFKIIVMLTEVSEFHQVYTRCQKIPEVEKLARTSPKHSPGFGNLTRCSPNF